MGKLIFITGGVRSGKSHFAEQLVRETRKPAAYVATSVAFDVEMQDRIKRHQQDRALQNVCWQLYEMPYDLNGKVEQSVILFECVTTWLTNMMFMQQHENPVPIFQQWIMHLLSVNKTVYIVSNEVLDGGLTMYAETNQYLQKIGELHCWLVQKSCEVYEINHKWVKQWK